MQDFFILQQFYNELVKTNSTNDKKDVLRKYKDNEFIKKILVATYHPFKQYYITSKNLKNKPNLCQDNYVDFFGMLDDFSERRITGHDAIACANGFIKNHQPFAELIYQIIDRNLETRATTTIINDIMPGLIPTFEVQLCGVYEKVKEKYDERLKKYEALSTDKRKKKDPPENPLDYENIEYDASMKLDGYRCVCKIDNESDARFFSRAGNEFLTLGKVAEAIKRLGFKNIVFDGEICINTLDGRDDFAGVQQEANTKDHTIERPKYWIFDMLEPEIFDAGEGGEKFRDRYEKLHEIFAYTNEETLAILEQFPITSEADMYAMRDRAIKAGREGLIVKKNTVYQGKRTNDILKAKVMEDDEFEVVDLEFEPQRVIINKVEVTEMLLATAVIMYKGNTVGVGSGFTLEQRRDFYENPEKLKGKIITVKYQGESQDKKGNFSLRFPVFKVLHGDERTM